MKLLLVLSSIFLVASAADTLYLKVEMINVNHQISASNLSYSIAGLITDFIPDEYNDLIPVIRKYGLNISFASEYNSTLQEQTLKFYFPKVPAEYNDKVLDYLDNFSTNQTVSKILTALLPTYLHCGQCKWHGLSAGLTSTTDPIPDPLPVLVRSIVGIRMDVHGASKLISEDNIQIAYAQFPKYLKQELDKLSDFSIVEKEVLSNFFKQVILTQSHSNNPNNLEVKVRFPNIPETIVELYTPLFEKYFDNNPEIRELVKTEVPKLVDCSADCTVVLAQVYTETTPAASFYENINSGNSASSLSVGFGLLMTIVAVVV